MDKEAFRHQVVLMQICIAFILLMVVGCRPVSQQSKSMEFNNVKRILLPTPITEGQISFEQSLLERRSVREFSDVPLSLTEIGQLLWAAQGITNDRGYRTAPSAGALYPLELYVVSSEAFYHYTAEEHALTVVVEGDFRVALCEVALNQEAICDAPVTIVMTAVYERIEKKYGPARSPRYVHLEAGHSAQNLLLQAVALDLGATPIGAFEDAGVQSVLGLPNDHEPLYLIPVGKAR